MIGKALGVDLVTFWQTFVLTFVFGVGYGMALYAARRARLIGRYSSVLTAFGVFVTLVMSAILIGWENAVVVMLLFAASGVPAIFEELYGNYKAEKKERETL